jgi:hypothetical protein
VVVFNRGYFRQYQSIRIRYSWENAHEFGTCDISHVKFHMWTHVNWSFTCETSHVKFHMWSFACEFGTCETHNFTCEISHVPNSHVKFHICEIMWNLDILIIQFWFQVIDNYGVSVRPRESQSARKSIISAIQ